MPPKKRKLNVEENIRVWLKEPGDDEPTLAYVSEHYLVGDLVNDLVTWEHFSFEGASPKLIKVQHHGRDIKRGALLSTISMSDADPLIAWVDVNLYGKQLRTFDIKPSGMKDKALVKFLIDNVSNWEELIKLAENLETALPLEDPVDNTATSDYSNMISNICFEGTESARLLKVTLMMATSLRFKQCKIVPYHILELPEKRPGHPLIADMIIKGSQSAESSSVGSSVSESAAAEQPIITTISHNECVIMIIECKKIVSPSVALVNSDDLMEMIIYCRYIIDIRQEQGIVIGILTDGISWHCFYFHNQDNHLLKIVKYMTFQSKEGAKIIATLPQLLQDLA